MRTLSSRTGTPICLSSCWKSSVLVMFLIPFDQLNWLTLALQGENFWRNWSYSIILLTQIFSSQGQILVKENSFAAPVVLFFSFKNIVPILFNLLLHKSWVTLKIQVCVTYYHHSWCLSTQTPRSSIWSKLKDPLLCWKNQKTFMKTVGNFAASPLHYVANQLLLTSSQQY